MPTECLPFSRVPHTSRLFGAYLAQAENVRRFFPTMVHGNGLSWVGEEAGRLHYDQERRRRVADILERQNRQWGASPQTLASVERFRQGANVFVTGQQVGLFGGPLFAIYKALTTVKLAAEASRAGFDCVPVFWLATEDHDLAEVNHATLLTAEDSLVALATASQAGPDAPMSSVRLGEDVEGLVDQAAEALADGEAATLLREAYRPGVGLGEAFGRLYARLFAEFGVILLDASDPELHRQASSVYRAAILGAAELDEGLLARDKELDRAGFHSQVKVTPSSTLLFGLRNGSRVPIHRAGDGFEFGGERLTAGELESRLKEAPERFSPNVLLRPVVQDYVLPTVAYVGGPAEVAYFAQAAVAYEHLLGRVTPILPRLSTTLVEPRIRRLLERYRLSLPDLFLDAERFRARLAGGALPEDVQGSFDSAFTRLESSLEELRTALLRLDPTLVDAGKKAGSKMLYQLNRLRARAARAELRRREELGRHADRLSAALYPNRQLQEREIAGISFIARHGKGLLTRLYEAVRPDCLDHQILYL